MVAPTLARVFTGIIETVGMVAEQTGTEAGIRLVIEAPALIDDLKVGASVAVNGTCLTAVEVGDGRFSVDMVAETIGRTAPAGLAVGSLVNLERAMPVNGRFDGHIVQGHVDGVGRIRSLRGEGAGVRMTIDISPGLHRYIVEKGSVGVHGVSLTVARTDESGFEVALIPHTYRVTNLHLLTEGDSVNLEVDILAKYIERLLRRT